MSATKLPRNIDIDSIFWFVERLREQKDESATFWKGLDSPGDEVETIFGRTSREDTVLSCADVIEDIERLATWLMALPPQ